MLEILRTDRDEEYISKKFEAYCERRKRSEDIHVVIEDDDINEDNNEDLTNTEVVNGESNSYEDQDANVRLQ